MATVIAPAPQNDNNLIIVVLFFFLFFMLFLLYVLPMFHGMNTTQIHIPNKFDVNVH